MSFLNLLEGFCAALINCIWMLDHVFGRSFMYRGPNFFKRPITPAINRTAIGGIANQIIRRWVA